MWSICELCGAEVPRGITYCSSCVILNERVEHLIQNSPRKALDYFGDQFLKVFHILRNEDD